MAGGNAEAFGIGCEWTASQRDRSLSVGPFRATTIKPARVAGKCIAYAAGTPLIASRRQVHYDRLSAANQMPSFSPHAHHAGGAPHHQERAAGGIPEYAVRNVKEIREKHTASFQRALGARVKIAMDTDAGTPNNLHGENLNELPLVVEAAMTPMQAIVASTRQGAKLLGLSDRVGVLEPSKLADLVVMDDNPLDDINLFKDPDRIVHVMKDGVIVRDSLPVVGSGAAEA